MFIIIFFISIWNTKNVIEMGFLFSRCSSLLTLPDISKWNLTIVKNINGIFSECSSLITLPDISNWLNYNIILIIHQKLIKNINLMNINFF